MNLFKSLRLRSKVFLTFSLVSLLTSVVFTSYTYGLQRATILDGIDEKLKAAALAIPAFLPEGFHDRVSGKLSVSSQEHLTNIHRLTDYATAVGVTFVYSLIKTDEGLYFTSTSEIARDLAAGYIEDFFLPYEYPSPALMRLFETGGELRETSRDEFGTFRSVVVVISSPFGKRRYVVGADMRIDDIEIMLNQTLRRYVLIGVLSFIATSVISVLMSNRITRPLTRLDEFALDLVDRSFTPSQDKAKDLAALAERGGDEVAHLARTFAQMLQTLDDYILDLKTTTAAKERLESELKIAHDIQMSFLPKGLPRCPLAGWIDLYATLEPAREVGGDLYDFGLVDDEHLFLCVGDVSGKGVPAALFMAMTMSLMKRGVQQPGIGPDQILERVNRDLAAENESFQFVTLFCAILDLRTGELCYSNAGHNPPILLRADGRADWLQLPEGMALALEEENRYQTLRLTLGKGEALLLYTDGITEAMNPDYQLYSDERLLATSGAFRATGAASLVKAVIQSVKEHAAEAPQSDDITALVLRYLGG